MPIVIDQFEISVEEPPKAPPRPSPESGAEAHSSLRPDDVVSVQRHQKQRIDRVRAD
jgi:hypothetical protein